MSEASGRNMHGGRCCLQASGLNDLRDATIFSAFVCRHMTAMTEIRTIRGHYGMNLDNQVAQLLPIASLWSYCLEFVGVHGQLRLVLEDGPFFDEFMSC